MTEKEKLNLIKNIIDSNLDVKDKFELIKLITKDFDYFTSNDGWLGGEDDSGKLID